MQYKTFEDWFCEISNSKNFWYDINTQNKEVIRKWMKLSWDLGVQNNSISDSKVLTRMEQKLDNIILKNLINSHDTLRQTD
jgi:hypothetical protein